MSNASEAIPARLYFILARNAEVGVIFRRGPNKWVQLIKWNTDSDTFEAGQWFHGRIYDRRSDLSPDGTKLIYFAKKMTGRTVQDTEYTYSWTAISKPPYFTALALWPKGDSWEGGGLFVSNNEVCLNHKPEVAIPHPNHMPPKKLKVISNPDARGEDSPILDNRLARDGWVCLQPWEGNLKDNGYVTVKPKILEKKHPYMDIILIMTSSLIGFDWIYTFTIKSSAGGTKTLVDDAEWADWDQRGRLVFVGGGKVFAAKVDESCEINRKELADFNANKHEPVSTPGWATIW